MVNEERAIHGLPALIWHDALAHAARLHSQDMAENGILSHIGFDGSFPDERIDRFGINFGAMAENVAAGQRTAQAVMNAWMNSPGHRTNILNPDLTHMGVGFENYYWTQKFITFS